MTTFQDGPAKGQKLMLRRAPHFLRVTMKRKGTAVVFDALDRLDDTPHSNETLLAYEIVGKAGNCHLYFGGGRGVWYAIATYRFSAVQPSQPQMRDTATWREWCQRQITQPA